MEFEWDLTKARHNVRTHGIAFLEAVTVVADPFELTIYDPDHWGVPTWSYWVSWRQ